MNYSLIFWFYDSGVGGNVGGGGIFHILLHIVCYYRLKCLLFLQKTWIPRIWNAFLPWCSIAGWHVGTGGVHFFPFPLHVKFPHRHIIGMISLSIAICPTATFCLGLTPPPLATPTFKKRLYVPVFNLSCLKIVDYCKLDLIVYHCIDD